LPIVLREHNFEALIYERFSKIGPNAAQRTVAKIHGKRLRKEETIFLKEFDAVAAITNEDAQLMRDVAPEAEIHIIPAGVDTEFFTPTADSAEDPNSILWVGSLAWDPNLDAVRYFLISIFPLISEWYPEARFDVIGTNSERVSKLAAKFGDRVRILGWVPDVRHYLSRSAVLVVPLRIGGGMRIKLLDFFAAGKAVVTTSVGSEGNFAQNENELLIADTAEDFADSIARLFADETLRKSLGRRARELVETRYSWPKVGQAFEQLYLSVIGEHKKKATA
jgi:glycosyltransferase involved in cell wall biosynthesis